MFREVELLVFCRGVLLVRGLVFVVFVFVFVLGVFRLVLLELCKRLLELPEPNVDDRLRFELELIGERDRLDEDRRADDRLADDRLLRNELPPPNLASAMSSASKQHPAAAVTASQRNFARPNLDVIRVEECGVLMIESLADSGVRRGCRRPVEAVPPEFRPAA